MTGQRRRLARDALHRSPSETRANTRKPARRRSAPRDAWPRSPCRSHSLSPGRAGPSSPRRPGCGRARGARREAAPLPEALELVERQVVARQVKERVEEHAAVPRREHDPVTPRPGGVGRVVAQVPRPRACAIGAAPIGRPACPDSACSTALTARCAACRRRARRCRRMARDTEAAPEGRGKGVGTIATTYPIARTVIRAGRRGGETRRRAGAPAAGRAPDPPGSRPRGFAATSGAGARHGRAVAHGVQHPGAVRRPQARTAGTGASPRTDIGRPVSGRRLPGSGWPRGRARCGRARPGRSWPPLVEHEIAGLVAPDQRVEPTGAPPRSRPARPRSRRGRSSSGPRPRPGRRPVPPRGRGRPRAGPDRSASASSALRAWPATSAADPGSPRSTAAVMRPPGARR